MIKKVSVLLLAGLMACGVNAKSKLKLTPAEQEKYAKIEAYLNESAKIVIDESTREVKEGPFKGIKFLKPCAGAMYEGGCWNRDFYYGCLTGLVPAKMVKDVYSWFKSHTDTEGVNKYQTPVLIYWDDRPYIVGDRPALDANAFVTMLIVLYYNQSGDEAFMRAEMPYLEKLMEHADRKDGLAYNSDHPNRVGFGFQDAVHMTGHLAYASVLYYDASMRALEVCKKLGINGKVFADVAKGVKKNFLPTFWDGKYLKASTGLCKGQFDLLAAAYAVSVGLVKGKAARQIMERVYSYNDEIQQYGFFKHLPNEYYYKPDYAWESSNSKDYPDGLPHADFYQWGAFWTIGSPHMMNALQKTMGKEVIRPMVDSMMEYVQSNNQFEEWHNQAGTHIQTPHYVQTVAAVQTCLRIFLDKPWTY